MHFNVAVVLVRGKGGGDGEAATEGLGKGHEVRFDVVDVRREHLAGAGQADLHLVKHEKRLGECRKKEYDYDQGR